MFFRTILELLTAVVVITLLRAVIGVLLKGFGDFFGSSSSSASGPAGRANPLPKADALKKDPVCGTFIAASTSIHKKVGQETYYFCSPECRDKFQG
ncbi:MAG TPA: hypothetical protein VFW83_06235 [Bryobacteraceae bacterium]|nr:hypothetical protein [Bryobacteraceae bacterium]